MPVINWNVVIVGLLYAGLTGAFNLAFAHKSQIEAWSQSRPRLAAFLKFTRAAGFDPWNLVASALLLFKARLPVAQQNGAKAVTALLAAQGNSAVSTPPERMFPSVIPPVVLVLAVCFAFHASACSLFGSGGSFWPVVEHCAPSPASLVSQVEGVLLAGGDYESTFEQIAKTDGVAALECALKEAVADLSGSSSGLSPKASSEAAARGRAFLAKKGVVLQ